MAWDVDVDEQLRIAITPQFRDAAVEAGYEVLYAAVDRHGSYVWEAGKAGPPNRFITLGLTAVEQEHGFQRYEVEVSFTVEDEVRFLHNVVMAKEHSFPFDPKVTHLSPDTSLLGMLDVASAPKDRAFWTKMREALIRAGERAEAVSSSELTESFVVPRPPSIHSSVHGR